MKDYIEANIHVNDDGNYSISVNSSGDKINLLPMSMIIQRSLHEFQTGIMKSITSKVEQVE